MKSKELFKLIFEKESNIVKSDIEGRIINSFKENSFFECKGIYKKCMPKSNDINEELTTELKQTA